MIKRSCSILSAVVLIALGCSSANLPGIGGTSSPEEIEADDHIPIPTGVSCYVCHKEDIPQQEFHAEYGNDCAECHVTTTWMAMDYAHPAWHLDSNHRTRCTRCHIAAGIHDYSQYQCWGCHHEQQETMRYHADLGIDDIDNCIACHENVDTSEDAAATE